MTIKQLTFKNFRSIGNNQSIEISELEKFNLFIGENNSGKSNIIRIIPFLYDLFVNLPATTGVFYPSVNNSHSQIEDLFYRDEKRFELSIVFLINDDEKSEFVSGVPTDINQSSMFKAKLFNNQINTIEVAFDISLRNDRALEYKLIRLIWADIPLIDFLDQILRGKDDQILPQTSFHQVYSNISGSSLFNYLNVILSKLRDFHTKFRIIKAVRKIGGTSQKDDGNTSSRLLGQLDIDGVRVIDMISTWTAPNNSHKVHRKLYRTLNNFVSNLLGIELTLIVSEDKNQLLIEPTKEEDGAIMSYKSWGSSVEELIILIVDILSSPANSIIALEEPEIHLDPFTQRKLIYFLKEKTDHQYFITSHSSVLINSFTDKSSTIFRVYKKDGITKTIRAKEEVLHHVLDDLGVKASDILQTEIEKNPDRAMVWITDGREIENYISSQSFKEILGIEGMDQYTKVSELKKNYLKVTSAIKLVENMSIEIFEGSPQLKLKINELVERIKLWNKEAPQV